MRARFALVVVVLAATLAMSAAPDSALIDCGADAACFSRRAGNCGPARLNLARAASALGWLEGDVVLTLVKQTRSGECLLDVDLPRAKPPSDVVDATLIERNRRQRCVFGASQLRGLVQKLERGEQVRRADVATCRLREPESGGADPRLARGCTLTPCEDGIRDLVCAVDAGIARCPWSWSGAFAPGTALCAEDGTPSVMYRAPRSGADSKPSSSPPAR